MDSTKPVRRAIKSLNQQYTDTNRSFRIEQVAGGYQLLTLPEYGEYLKRLQQKDVDAKLSKAALETLAIIAYKQPILRADIEAIRGVACGETIRSLMEKHLVKIAGRAEEPGRPILYGTTRRFLELFGLNRSRTFPNPRDFHSPPPPLYHNNLDARRSFSLSLEGEGWGEGEPSIHQSRSFGQFTLRESSSSARRHLQILQALPRRLPTFSLH